MIFCSELPTLANLTALETPELIALHKLHHVTSLSSLTALWVLSLRDCARVLGLPLLDSLKAVLCGSTWENSITEVADRTADTRVGLQI
jgi:hypothetical protein